MTLPDRGPTPLPIPKLVEKSQKAVWPSAGGKASARVTARPTTKAPMPAARNAAAGGPLGLSSCWVVIGFVLSVDRCGLGDEGAEGAGDAGCRERQREVHEQRQAPVASARELRAVVQDHEGDRGGQHRRDPGHVLLPLHGERVPGRGGRV